MTRTSIFILGLSAALAFPATASASCGTNQGSFAVTCEKGVTVYRHNSLSGIPAPISSAQASLESEKIRAKTASAALAAQERSDARLAKLRERELTLADYQSRVAATESRRNSRYSAGSARGYFSRPVLASASVLNSKY